MSDENRPFFALFNALVDGGTWASLTAGEQAVLPVLLRHMDEKRIVFPGVSRIAKLAGVHARNARRALGRLTDRGILQTIDAGGGSHGCTTRRRISIPTGDENATGDEIAPRQRVTKSPPTPGENATGTGDENARSRGAKTPPKGAHRRGTGKGHSEGAQIPASLSSSPAFLSAWQAWQDHRREKKKTLTPRSVELQLRDCAAWGADRAVAAIEHSIKQGYIGLFEPKGGNGTNGNGANGHRPRHRGMAESLELPPAIDFSTAGTGQKGTP